MNRITVVGLLVALCASLVTSLPIPESQSREDTRPAAIDRLLTGAYPSDEPGAAVIVTEHGKVLFRRGYGLADLELGVGVTPDMVFRIGSITKSFTAIAVLTLVQRGALALDDDVRDYLPDLPAYETPITIRQLLSHTSGMADLFDESYYDLIEARCYSLLNDDLEVGAFTELIDAQEPLAAPGETWSYSNAGYFLLGRIIEKVSGKSYADYVDEAIVQPMGLGRTGIYSNLAIVRGRVKGYLEGDAGDFIRNPYGSLSSTIVYSAGGLVSSVDDLARLSASLDGHVPLDARHLEQMFTPATDLLGGSTRYALGWFTTRLRGRDAIYHSGDVYGFSATMWRMPGERLFVAILSAHPSQTSKDLELLAKRILAIAIGEPFPSPERTIWAEESLKDLAGVYRFTPELVREVIVEDSRIFSRRNGGRKVELFATSSGIFVYDRSLTHVSFRRNDSGSVTRMLIHRDSGEVESAPRVDELESSE